MNGRTKISAGYVALVALALAVYLPALHVGLTRGRIRDQAIEDAGRVSGMGLRGWKYSQKHNGVWPPMSAKDVRFTYGQETDFESYVFGGPGDGPPDDSVRAILFGHLNQHSSMTLKPLMPNEDYFYLGYAITTEAEGLALVEAVQHAASFDLDIPVAPGKGTLGSSKLYRLNYYVADYLARDGVTKNVDSQLIARMPVLIERPKGSHAFVLFLDSHVESLPYPGQFPMSERFIEALESTRPQGGGNEGTSTQ